MIVDATLRTIMAQLGLNSGAPRAEQQSLGQEKDVFLSREVGGSAHPCANVVGKA